MVRWLAVASLATASVLIACTSKDGAASPDTSDAGDSGVTTSLVDDTFGSEGILPIVAGTGRVLVYEAPDGHTMMLRTAPNAGDFDDGVRVRRFLANGDADPSYAAYFAPLQTNAAQRDDVSSGCLDPLGRFVVMVMTTQSHFSDPDLHDVTLTRIDANGKLDTSFGTGGAVTVHDTIPSELTCDGASLEVLGNRQLADAQTEGGPIVKWSITSDGHAGTTTPAVTLASSAKAPRADGSGGILATASFGDHSEVLHFDAHGAADAAFGAGGALRLAPSNTDVIHVASVDRKRGTSAVLLESGGQTSIVLVSKTGASLATVAISHGGNVTFDSEGRAVVMRSLGMLMDDSMTDLGFSLLRFDASGTADDAYGERRFDHAFFRAHDQGMPDVYGIRLDPSSNGRVYASFGSRASVAGSFADPYWIIRVSP